MVFIMAYPGHSLPITFVHFSEEPDCHVKIEKQEFKKEAYGEIPDQYIPESGTIKQEYLIPSSDSPITSIVEREECNYPVKVEKEEFIQEVYGEALCPYIPESCTAKDEPLISLLDRPIANTAEWKENLGKDSGSSNPKLKIKKNSSLQERKKEKGLSRLFNDTQTHTGEKLLECNYCSARFDRRSNLVCHIRTHTGEKPFGCDSCSAKFAQRVHLVNHIRTHTGEKPFTCDSCPARFATRIHLVNHTRTHTGEKPFECNSCSARFAQSGSLTRHIRKHTGEKPFGCDSCSSRFAEKGTLVRHLRTHSDTKPLE